MTAESLPDTTLPIDRIVVLDNPYSKNGDRGRRQLDRLVESSGLPAHPIETDRNPAVTAGRLSILKSTDLVYVIGGDGTVNAAIEPVRESGAILLPTRSGNANDLAMSMNGRRAPWKIFRDYKTGTAIPLVIRPIEVSVGNGAETIKKTALNYASVGYAALASEYINQPWRRAGMKRFVDRLPSYLQSLVRLPKEATALAKAAYDIDRFEYKESGGAEASRVVDISVVHSRRMAKFGKFPVRHTDPYMLTANMPDIGVFSMAKQFIRMMAGRMKTRSLPELNFSINNPTDQKLYFQVDGEASPLPRYADVSVGLAEKPVRILSTRH